LYLIRPPSETNYQTGGSGLSQKGGLLFDMVTAPARSVHGGAMWRRRRA
jgi:hypothetical protein